MNYPVWECYFAGGGLIVAIIAIFHVFVAHFAVGGGFFLVITEYLAYRKKDFLLIRYVKEHTLFFLLLTLVFGSLSGVGIWFSISVISPSSTSTLLSTFVFIWAIEWLFFIGEIISLLIYWYCFDKISRKQHIRIGIVYCIFSWLSLFAINGIISFMLTPGMWISTGIVCDGFFNPTMLPSLGFRTFMSSMIAGIFGFVTAVFVKNNRLKSDIINWCFKWTLLSLIMSIPFIFWYFSLLDIKTKELFIGFSPETLKAQSILFLSIPLILLVLIFIAIKTEGKIQKIFSFILLFMGFIYIGSFEWFRESSRRPYIIPNHTYSNSIKVIDSKEINEKGILKVAKWVENKEIFEDNILKAGREIFNIQCLSCHSIGGPLNNILKVAENFTVHGLYTQLSGQGKLRKYMPPFFGNKTERLALSEFIMEQFNYQCCSNTEPLKIKQKSFSLKPFNESKDEYILIATPQYGISEFQEYEKDWTISAPPNNIYAQLIFRGKKPKIITEDIIISYTINGYEGTMVLSEKQMAFFTDQIPSALDSKTIPYDPLILLTAKDSTTGDILAETQIIVPNLTEFSCKNCHIRKNSSGSLNKIRNKASESIFKAHDKINKTSLLRKSEKGEIINCRVCHSDNFYSKAQKPLNLSAAIHGFHSVYMSDEGNEVCHNCHSISSYENRSSFRGIHKSVGLECINCHGDIKAFAISLLKEELKFNKILANKSFENKEDKYKILNLVNSRRPWINLPDCLNCHSDYNSPDTDTHPIDQWTISEEELYIRRTDKAGIMCITCHGSSHAIYPSSNKLDTIGMIQYDGKNAPMGSESNCKVCHKIDMGQKIHHSNNF